MFFVWNSFVYCAYKVNESKVETTWSQRSTKMSPFQSIKLERLSFINVYIISIRVGELMSLTAFWLDSQSLGGAFSQTSTCVSKRGSETNRNLWDERRASNEYQAPYYETWYLSLSYFNFNAPLIADAGSVLRLQLSRAKEAAELHFLLVREGRKVFFYGETKISKKVIASKSRRSQRSH